MFNLDQAISEWRRQMVAGGIKEPDDPNELESHLREDVARQVSEGVDAQQAFEDAVARFGPASGLKAEFKKVGKTADLRVKRIALEASGLLYVAAVSYALITHEMAGQERLLGFSGLAFAIVSSFGVKHVARWIQTEGRTRTVLGAGSAILSVGWLTCFIHLILPHLDFTPSQLVVALLWALAPMVASGAFALELEESSVRRRGIGDA